MYIYKIIYTYIYIFIYIYICVYIYMYIGVEGGTSVSLGPKPWGWPGRAGRERRASETLKCSWIHSALFTAVLVWA